MTTLNEKQWFIFRHGLATLSKTGYGDKILTAEVLPEGIPPVRVLGAALKDKPYDFGACSEFIRCQQTAAIITEITGRTFVTEPRLNEQHNESFESMRARVRDFLDEMSTTPYEHLWVCTHGAIIAALKHLLISGDHTRAHENDYIQPGELLFVHQQRAEVLKFS